MEKSYKMYRGDLQSLKGLCIISVVFYHLGLMPYGYLGVDTFFVINGFFILPNLYKSIAEGNFEYYKFLLKRFTRLMPLIIIASFVCLIVGLLGMMPDDYENLCQSIFATNICSNNILSAITTGNYWDVANDYKPLMHTWYVGILVQFYVAFPCLLMLLANFAKYTKKNVKQIMIKGIICVTVISIFLFLLPSITYTTKFYYLPYRLFELCLGGILGIIYTKNKYSLRFVTLLRFISWPCLVLLFIYSFRNLDSVSNIVPIGDTSGQFVQLTQTRKEFILIMTVFFSCFLLIDAKKKNIMDKIFENKIFTLIGKYSFSIFIWHQIILAFWRYFMSDELNLYNLIIYLLIIFILSALSYKYIENIQMNKLRFIVSSVLFLITSLSALIVYFRAGVVRDVPELDITFENPYVSRNTEYTDAIYDYDVDFSHKENKIKILVIGNSFARDFACVLLESSYKDSISLSYSYSFNESLIKRIKKSDYIFCFSSKSEVPRYVWDNVRNQNSVWGIGTKSFGDSNGVIYKNRFKKDYFQQTIHLNENYCKLNSLWKKEWGNNYIDFIQMAKTSNNQILIFTPNNKFISQDCRHLTKNGAIYFSTKIDFSKIFQK